MATNLSQRTVQQLWVYLDDIAFPCSRNEILKCAEENEAPDLILDAIEDLPERRYRNIREVLYLIKGSS
jgi:hypothetical protein